MLEFDARTARFLDDAYQGADVTRRRRANFDALDPRPGETVIDIGCGTGLLTEEIARAVGPQGDTVGVDPSPAMRSAAAARLDGRAGARVLDGSAHALPVGKAGADRAVALQVFEYLDDIPGALAEAARALRPGGRLVVGDIHWDTFCWASDDPDRMARMMRAWDGHLADRTVPQTLPGLLAAGGFRYLRSVPVCFCDTILKPDGVAGMMMVLMRRYAQDKALLTEAEIAAWEAEQHERAATGRFFQSIVHYVTVAERL